ncbi:MAG: Imm8 family immunity protein [Clostridiaceae bacterium]|nr:Imm8 family immunity protein [Clostridiaceae bacterium]
MIMIKTFVKMMEEWGEDTDDFYVSYEVGIGPKEINGAFEVFNVDIISPKRLEKVLENGGVIIPRGYMITSDFNVNEIEGKINKIIKKCEMDNLDDTYYNISKFLRWEEDNI